MSEARASRKTGEWREKRLLRAFEKTVESEWKTAPERATV
jgi:hypothetical protein